MREPLGRVRRAPRHRPGPGSGPGRRTGCNRWCGRSPAGRSWPGARSGAVPKPLTILCTSKPSVSILWSPVSSMRAEIWVPPARLAVGAMTMVSCAGSSRALVAIHSVDFRRGQLPSFEHQDAVLGVFPVGQLGEQFLLHPRVSAERARSHREVLAGRDRPAGILRGHARSRRVVGGDLHSGPVFPAHRDSRVDYPSQSAHADLAQDQAGLEPAFRSSPRIDDPRAVGERVHRHPEPIGLRHHAVRQKPSPPVHSQSGHAAHHSRISPLPNSARSPLWRRYKPLICASVSGAPYAVCEASKNEGDVRWTVGAGVVETHRAG